jgi:3-deoxy-D-manno-octulosonic acid kinase
MRFHDSLIIQQPSVLHPLSDRDFDLDFWRAQDDACALDGGRGASQKIILRGEAFVLRHYLRGGLMARLLYDQYLWTGLTHSRPFRESKVIDFALQQQLPVAQVTAYQIQRSGMFYRASIISRYIENRGTLADCLVRSSLDQLAWKDLGLLIRRMHEAGIYHADLNANNILLDEHNHFHLIDFDKARRLPASSSKLKNNVQRLRRSLLKIARQQARVQQAFHFSEANWACFIQSYMSP